LGRNGPRYQSVWRLRLIDQHKVGGLQCPLQPWGMGQALRNPSRGVGHRRCPSRSQPLRLDSWTKRGVGSCGLCGCGSLTSGSRPCWGKEPEIWGESRWSASTAALPAPRGSCLPQQQQSCSSPLPRHSGNTAMRAEAGRQPPSPCSRAKAGLSSHQGSSRGTRKFNLHQHGLACVRVCVCVCVPLPLSKNKI